MLRLIAGLIVYAVLTSGCVNMHITFPEAPTPQQEQEETSPAPTKPDMPSPDESKS